MVLVLTSVPVSSDRPMVYPFHVLLGSSWYSIRITKISKSSSTIAPGPDGESLQITALPYLFWIASLSSRLQFSLYFGDCRSRDFACFREQRDVWAGSICSILCLQIFDCKRNLFFQRRCLSVQIHPVVLVRRQGMICRKGRTHAIVVLTWHDGPLPIDASRINLQPYF